MNKKYHLVISSNRQTWGNGRPILFLGEWCRRHQEAHIWRELDHICMESDPLYCTPLLDDNIEAVTIMNNLTKNLGRGLNRLHRENRSERYWQIILQPWVYMYVHHISSLFHRLEKAFSEHNLVSTAVVTDKIFSQYAPSDLEEFVACLGSQDWNAQLILEIIPFLPSYNSTKSNFKIEKIECSESVTYGIAADTTKYNKVFIKDLVRRCIYSILNLVPVRKNQPFIIGSFLPFYHDALLKISFLGSPAIFKSQKIQRVAPNYEVRADMNRSLKNDDFSPLESVIYSVISRCIPTSYIEGYGLINKTIDNLKWPENPKFIFTSNNYHWDEVFKIWAAKKIEVGVPYFIGQHGNSYGTHKFSVNCPDELMPDKFLTWGWTRDGSRHIPTFLLKTSTNKKVKNDKQGGLLLILPTNDYRTSIMTYYMENHKRRLALLGNFYCELSQKPRSEVTVRLLHGDSALYGGEELYWRNINNKIDIESGLIPIKRLVKKYRIIVHGYDSTGILETLAQEIPTIAIILEHDMDLLLPDVVSDYKKLISCKIIHLTSESAADHINNIWDNIDLWWNSDLVFSSRKEFSSKYAYVAKRPVLTLRRTLVSATRSVSS